MQLIADVCANPHDSSYTGTKKTGVQIISKVQSYQTVKFIPQLKSLFDFTLLWTKINARFSWV